MFAPPWSVVCQRDPTMLIMFRVLGLWWGQSMIIAHSASCLVKLVPKRVLHQKHSGDCFGHQQIGTVTCIFCGKHQFGCKHSQAVVKHWLETMASKKCVCCSEEAELLLWRRKLSHFWFLLTVSLLFGDHRKGPKQSQWGFCQLVWDIFRIFPLATSGC